MLSDVMTVGSFFAFFSLEAEEFPNFWIDQAKEELDAALNLEGLNKNVAKNIIILLGEKLLKCSTTYDI